VPELRGRPKVAGYTLGEYVADLDSAAVYEATAADGTPVAIKIVPAAPPDVGRAEAVVALRHPSLVRVHDITVTDAGDTCIVTAPLPAGSVAGFLRAGPVPADVVVTVGIRIADALAAAHASEPALLHGQLGPHTILVAATGEPLLAGLAEGLVTARRGASDPYAPPETLDGAPPSTGGDVYSLAATLFALLTGEPPFGHPGDDGDDSHGFAARVRQAPVPPVGRLDLPPAAEDAIRKALAKEPARRFATAADFRDALAAATGVVSVEEAGPSAPDVPDRSAPRRSAAPALVALAVVAVLVVAIILISALAS
jgi:serine/threonine protein kinase